MIVLLKIIGVCIIIALIIMFLIAHGFVWMYKFLVLMLIPAAPVEYQPTLETYDAFQVIVREYDKVAFGKYPDNFFDLIEGSTTVKLKGDYIFRSDGRRVFIIKKEDDSKFAKEDIFKVAANYPWALQNCRNNGKGCDASLSVRYRFEVSKGKDSNSLPLPYEYDLIYKRK